MKYLRLLILLFPFSSLSAQAQQLGDISKLLAIQQATIESLREEVRSLKEEVKSQKGELTAQNGTIKTLAEKSTDNQNSIVDLRNGSLKFSQIGFDSGSSIVGSSSGLLLRNQVGSYLILPTDDHFAYYGRFNNSQPIWSCGGSNCGRPTP
jgi:uncharacterized coiled-coil protein SlyX